MFNRWMDGHNFIRKFISGIVVSVFMAFFVFADAYGAIDFGLIPAAMPAAEFARLDVETFTVPAHLGEVKFSFKGDTDKLIVHIQDAHCNSFAQHKISGLIDYLTTEYGIRVLNLEGGVGSYDLNIFTSISGEAIRREVADHFVKTGEISGAEFYAVNNPGKVELWGVEDKELYLANLKVYRDSLAYKEEVDGYLKELTYLLNNLKRHIYTPELLKIDIEYSAYKAGNKDFRDYLEFLIRKAREEGIEVRSYPNLYLLMQAMDMENDIDFDKANTERSVLVDELKKVLSQNEMKELIAKSVGFKTKRISRKIFYDYLLKKAGDINLDIANFPALSNYIVYVSLYEAVDRTKVMDELDRFEAEIKEPLFKNDTQRKLDKLSKNLAIMKNIFAITLTKTDYQYYLDNKDSFSVKNYLDFIKNEGPKYRITAKTSESIERLDYYREEISRFYEYSFQRDKAFLKNLRFSQVPNNGESAVLMTGGFHTENLCDLLKENGISYVSILPKFTSEEDYESPYFKLLAGETANVQQMLRSAIAQSMKLAIASVLNPVLAESVWGQANITAFDARVVMQDMANRGAKVELVNNEGEVVYTARPDRAEVEARTTLRLTPNVLVDLTVDRLLIAQEIEEARRAGNRLINVDQEYIDNAIARLQDVRDKLEAAGATAAQLEMMDKIIEKLKTGEMEIQFIRDISRPILREMMRGHAYEGGIIISDKYINENGKARDSIDQREIEYIIVHEAVAQFARVDSVSVHIENMGRPIATTHPLTPEGRRAYQEEKARVVEKPIIDWLLGNLSPETMRDVALVDLPEDLVMQWKGGKDITALFGKAGPNTAQKALMRILGIKEGEYNSLVAGRLQSEVAQSTPRKLEQLAEVQKLKDKFVEIVKETVGEENAQTQAEKILRKNTSFSNLNSFLKAAVKSGEKEAQLTPETRATLFEALGRDDNIPPHIVMANFLSLSTSEEVNESAKVLASSLRRELNQKIASIRDEGRTELTREERVELGELREEATRAQNERKDLLNEIAGQPELLYYLKRGEGGRDYLQIFYDMNGVTQVLRALVVNYSDYTKLPLVAKARGEERRQRIDNLIEKYAESIERGIPMAGPAASVAREPSSAGHRTYNVEPLIIANYSLLGVARGEVKERDLVEPVLDVANFEVDPILASALGEIIVEDTVYDGRGVASTVQTPCRVNTQGYLERISDGQLYEKVNYIVTEERNPRTGKIEKVRREEKRPVRILSADKIVNIAGEEIRTVKRRTLGEGGQQSGPISSAVVINRTNVGSDIVRRDVINIVINTSRMSGKEEEATRTLVKQQLNLVPSRSMFEEQLPGVAVGLVVREAELPGYMGAKGGAGVEVAEKARGILAGRGAAALTGIYDEAAKAYRNIGRGVVKEDGTLAKVVETREEAGNLVVVHDTGEEIRIGITGERAITREQLVNSINSFLSDVQRDHNLTEDEERIIYAIPAMLMGAGFDSIKFIEYDERIQGHFGTNGVLYLDKALYDTERPQALIHELMHGYFMDIAEAEGVDMTAIAGVNMHTVARGVGEDVRIAYELYIEEFDSMPTNMEDYIDRLDEKVKIVRGSSMTPDEKKWIEYRYNTRSGRNKRLPVNNIGKVLLMGLQEDLDPESFQALTELIAHTRDNARRGTQNMVYDEHYNVAKSGVLDKWGKKASRQISRKWGVDNTYQSFDATKDKQSIKDILDKIKENTAKGEDENKAPMTLIKCVKKSTLRELQLRLGLIGLADVEEEYRDSLRDIEPEYIDLAKNIVIVDNTEKREDYTDNVLRLLTYANLLLNERRLGRYFNMSEVDPMRVEVRKDTLDLLGSAGYLTRDAVDAYVAGVKSTEELNNYFNALYAGNIVVMITPIDWQDVRDYNDAMEAVYRSL